MQYLESVEMTGLEDEQVAAEPPEAAIDLEAFWNRVYARLRNDQERQQAFGGAQIVIGRAFDLRRLHLLPDVAAHFVQ